MIGSPRYFFVMIGVICLKSQAVHSYGRLWEPPARSTMWRRGFNTPINFNDVSARCREHQGAACGVCGDALTGPRENESGGKYATGKISRTYHEHERVTFQVDLPAHHKGYIEFKICPTNDPRVKETQDCFNHNMVHLADSSSTRAEVDADSRLKKIAVQLPPNLVCKFCVLQFHYHGNITENDEEEKCKQCGSSEDLFGCSDVRIIATNYSQEFEQVKFNSTVTNSTNESHTVKYHGTFHGINSSQTETYHKSKNFSANETRHPENDDENDDYDDHEVNEKTDHVTSTRKPHEQIIESSRNKTNKQSNEEHSIYLINHRNRTTTSYNTSESKLHIKNIISNGSVNNDTGSHWFNFLEYSQNNHNMQTHGGPEHRPPSPKRKHDCKLLKGLFEDVYPNKDTNNDQTWTDLYFFSKQDVHRKNHEQWLSPSDDMAWTGGSVTHRRLPPKNKHDCKLLKSFFKDDYPDQDIDNDQLWQDLYVSGKKISRGKYGQWISSSDHIVSSENENTHSPIFDEWEIFHVNKAKNNPESLYQDSDWLKDESEDKNNPESLYQDPDWFQDETENKYNPESLYQDPDWFEDESKDKNNSESLYQNSDWLEDESEDKNNPESLYQNSDWFEHFNENEYGQGYWHDTSNINNIDNWKDTVGSNDEIFDSSDNHNIDDNTWNSIFDSKSADAIGVEEHHFKDFKKGSAGTEESSKNEESSDGYYKWLKSKYVLGASESDLSGLLSTSSIRVCRSTHRTKRLDQRCFISCQLGNCPRRHCTCVLKKLKLLTALLPIQILTFVNVTNNEVTGNEQTSLVAKFIKN